MSPKTNELVRELVALPDADWRALIEQVRVQREAREKIAWLQLAEPSAARDWDNEQDAAYDDL